MQEDASEEAKVWTFCQDVELFSTFLDLEQLTVNMVTVRPHAWKLFKNQNDLLIWVFLS